MQAMAKKPKPQKKPSSKSQVYTNTVNGVPMCGFPPCQYCPTTVGARATEVGCRYSPGGGAVVYAHPSLSDTPFNPWIATANPG